MAIMRLGNHGSIDLLESIDDLGDAGCDRPGTALELSDNCEKLQSRIAYFILNFLNGECFIVPVGVLQLQPLLPGVFHQLATE